MSVSADSISTDDLAPYLEPGTYVQSDHPGVIAFARQAVEGCDNDIERAIALYYAVRDEIRYDPYVNISDEALYYASHCLDAKRGFCISKAVLLAASARVVGIPSRVAFADVKNHLCTPRLRDMMGTDLFTHHGFTELHLDGRWVKVTPTFNIELCQRFGVVALDFDGRSDSLLHAFDTSGRLHMEYVKQRGAYADVPMATLRSAMLETYGPEVCKKLAGAGDFAAEAKRSRTA